jgi:hypothetical protein
LKKKYSAEDKEQVEKMIRESIESILSIENTNNILRNVYIAFKEDDFMVRLHTLLSI